MIFAQLISTDGQSLSHEKFLEIPGLEFHDEVAGVYSKLGIVFKIFSITIYIIKSGSMLALSSIFFNNETIT